MSRDYREHVIEQLAATEAALRGRIDILVAEREAYRLVACEATARLQEQYARIERLRAQLQALRNELSRYTAAIIREASAQEAA